MASTRTEAGACERDPPLSWDRFGQQFMHTHCAGCHSSSLPEALREGAPIGVDLDQPELDPQSVDWWDSSYAAFRPRRSPSPCPAAFRPVGDGLAVCVGEQGED